MWWWQRANDPETATLKESVDDDDDIERERFVLRLLGYDSIVDAVPSLDAYLHCATVY
jgi:hypothetical protein